MHAKPPSQQCEVRRRLARQSQTLIPLVMKIGATKRESLNFVEWKIKRKSVSEPAKNKGRRAKIGSFLSRECAFFKPDSEAMTDIPRKKSNEVETVRQFYYYDSRMVICPVVHSITLSYTQRIHAVAILIPGFPRLRPSTPTMHRAIHHRQFSRSIRPSCPF